MRQALGGFATLFVAALFVAGSSSPSRGSSHDALHRRVEGELGVFIDWLEANDAEGFVGEIGWPDDYRGDAAKWNLLADSWYSQADAAGLWVTQWSTGEWWDGDYKLAPYEDRRKPRGLESVNSQAVVTEAHPSTDDYLRGVNVSGAEFGTPPSLAPKSAFSNKHSGRYNRAYHYDRTATFDFLATHGLELVRLQFRWERIQPQLRGRLDPVELERLASAVDRAQNAGLHVVLDVHNYGDYYIERDGRGIRFTVGSKRVPVGAFADLWRRLSYNFEDTPGVAGYGLMNEPAGMEPKRDMQAARVWERASQKALDGIRARGDETLVMVQGYRWAGAQSWAKVHPTSWIDDPADNFRYEAHHYWDRDHSGTYRHSYRDEVRHSYRHGYVDR